jgi:hypothetical protein
MTRKIRTPIRALLAAACMPLLAAGCAATRVDGQWSDPAFAGRTLLGTKVLVSCRGPDTTVARLCEDRLAEMLDQAGAVVLRAPQPVDPAGGVEAVARAAREAGANSAVSAAINVAGVSAGGYGFGPSIGFGLGGFGGRGAGGIGIGAGFSVPLGGVRPATSYASSTAVLDTGSGREMWSMRASNPGGDDVGVQVAALSRATVDAMRRSGLFDKR